MAEQEGSSSNPGRRRHKPIQPPSPEPRRALPFTMQEQIYYNRRPVSPRERNTAGHRYHHPTEQPYYRDTDSTPPQGQQQRKAKGSVFERLGGNTAPQSKRTNACLSWMNTGACARGRQCIYAHPPLSPDKQQHGGYEQNVGYSHHRVGQAHPGHHRHVSGSDGNEFAEHSPRAIPERTANVPQDYGEYRRTRRRRDSAEPQPELCHSERREGHGEKGQIRSSRAEAASASSMGSAEDVELSDQENAKLRSKVVVTKAKREELKDSRKGATADSSRATYIPSQVDFSGDNQELESEEALKQQLKELRRQLKELDEGEGGLEEPPHDGRNRTKPLKRQLEEMEASEKGEANKNGVVTMKRARHHLNEREPCSPASSTTTLTIARRHHTTIRSRNERDQVGFSRDGEGKPHAHHRDDGSVRSYGSASRKRASPATGRSSRHVNGERLPHDTSEWQVGNRSPSVGTSSLTRRHRTEMEQSHKFRYRQQHEPVTPMGSHSISDVRYRDDQGRFPPHPSPDRHPRLPHIRGLDTRRTGAPSDVGRSRAMDLSFSGSRIAPQHEQQHRRLPDRIYERMDDRGNHSKSRTSSSGVRDAHHPPSGGSSLLRQRLHSRRQLRTSKISSERGSAMRTGGDRGEHRTSWSDHRHTTEHKRPHYRMEGEVGTGRRKHHTTDDDAHGRTGKRGKGGTGGRGRVDGEDDQCGPDRTGADSVDTKPASSPKVEKAASTVLTGMEGRPMLEQRELEPISDDEVEEMSGDSLCQVTGDRLVDDGKRIIDDLLNVEWADAMPEPGPSQRHHRRFDLGSFWPAIAACAEYADEEILDAAEQRDRVDIGRPATVNASLALDDFPGALSAWVDLKMRRRLCGLVSETESGAGGAVELNAPWSGRTARAALQSFQKWTENEEDCGDYSGESDDEFRTTAYS